MNNHDQYIDEFLESCGIDSDQMLGRTLTLVRATAMKKAARCRQWKWVAISSCLFSMIFYGIAIYFWRYHIVLHTTAIRQLGFAKPRNQNILFVFLWCGTIALSIGLVVFLTFTVKRWILSRRLKQVKTNLSDADRVPVQREMDNRPLL